MTNSFIIKGNICQTITPSGLDLHSNAYAICVDGVSKGVFDTIPEEYLGSDEKNITAKFVAGRKII